MTPQRALASLLFACILAMPITARWPYAALQLALFGWMAASALRRRWNGNLLVHLVGAAAAWGLLQVAFGTTVYAQATLEGKNARLDRMARRCLAGLERLRRP
jgi:hypothetical protein